MKEYFILIFYLIVQIRPQSLVDRPSQANLPSTIAPPPSDLFPTPSAPPALPTFPTLPPLFPLFGPPAGNTVTEVPASRIDTAASLPSSGMMVPMDPFLAIFLPQPMTPPPQSPPGPPQNALPRGNTSDPFASGIPPPFLPPFFPSPMPTGGFAPGMEFPPPGQTPPTPPTPPPFVTFPPIPLSRYTFNVTMAPPPRMPGGYTMMPTMKPLAIPMHDMNYTKHVMEFSKRFEYAMSRMPQMLSEGPRGETFPHHYMWALRTYNTPTKRYERKMGNIFVDDRMRGVRLYTFCKTCGRGRK